MTKQTHNTIFGSIALACLGEAIKAFVKDRPDYIDIIESITEAKR